MDKGGKAIRTPTFYSGPVYLHVVEAATSFRIRSRTFVRTGRVPVRDIFMVRVIVTTATDVSTENESTRIAFTLFTTNGLGCESVGVRTPSRVQRTNSPSDRKFSRISWAYWR